MGLVYNMKRSKRFSTTTIVVNCSGRMMGRRPTPLLLVLFGWAVVVACYHGSWCRNLLLVSAFSLDSCNRIRGKITTTTTTTLWIQPGETKQCHSVIDKRRRRRRNAKGRDSSSCSSSSSSTQQQRSVSTSTRLWSSNNEYDEYDEDIEWEDDDDEDEGDWDEKAKEFDLDNAVGLVNGGEASLQTLSYQIAQTQQQLQVQQQQINQMLQLLLPAQMPNAVQSSTPTTTHATTGADTTSSWTNGATNALSSPSQSSSSSSSSSTSSAVVPLRVMVFIDGTWVYYSLFERDGRCPIANQYGYGWYEKYRFNWEALPGVICRALQDPWSSDSSSSRPLEIARMSVFTSFKATTAESSNRYQMFQDMRAAGYDVFRLETVGRGEKCVDIQLAVEMLHYATVPNAYDVAVLLSGDKDFMPALIRVRQKGRKVAIVSMKSGVNRALCETDGLKDYDMVWLEDYFDELVVPLDEPTTERAKTAEGMPKVHPYVIMRVAWEFVSRASRVGLRWVSSRDLGRFLKSLRIDDTDSFLDEIKTHHMNLNAFLRRSNLFHFKDSTVHKGKWLSPMEKDRLDAMTSQVQLDPDDTKLLENFLSSMPTDHEAAYYFSIQGSPGVRVEKTTSLPRREKVHVAPVAVELPHELTTDYSQYTVPMLKERCRERGLSVSGLKADLLERVQKDVEEERAKLERTFQPIERTRDETAHPRDETANYLIGLLAEYLQASGGHASSRDVGRYLAANTRRLPGSSRTVSANAELKANFGSINKFVAKYDDLFEIDDDFVDGTDSNAVYAFRLSLKKQS